MKDQIGRNVYAYLMSYWEDLDDHLGRLEPNDLNLDYVGVSHLDCVSRVGEDIQFDKKRLKKTIKSYFFFIYCIQVILRTTES